MKHHNHTEKELKKIAIDAYNGKIFTSLQCDPNILTSVFSIILFLNKPPTPPKEPELKYGSNIRDKRKNKLNHIDETEVWMKKMEHYNKVTYPEWERNEKPKNEEYIRDIGMIYEDMDKALPRTVNGYPMFFSCKILNKKDSIRFIEIYKSYFDKRQELEKNF